MEANKMEADKKKANKEANNLEANSLQPAMVVKGLVATRKPRRRRNKPPRSTLVMRPDSDGLSLHEREREALEMLEKVGFPWGSIQQAVETHLTSTDKKFRLALRVATALVRLKGPTQEDMINQLDDFYLDVTACVYALDLEDKQEARDLRSIFLLAGHHRAKDMDDKPNDNSKDDKPKPEDNSKDDKPKP